MEALQTDGRQRTAAVVRRRGWLWLLTIGLMAGAASKSPAAIPTGDILGTHDPSRIIKCGGTYYVYSTGRNIASRTSSDLIHWTRGPSVLASVPAWAHQAVPAARGDFVWAPDVIFLGGKYWLFYSYSTFGSRVSVIGLVQSPTLDPASPDYHWKDDGLVIASTLTDSFNAIDPAPFVDAQGGLWLSFGSWNRGGIRVVKLDSETGKPIGAAITLAAGQATGPEASYVQYHDGYYYLFENEGLCCKGMDSTYRVMMGRSRTVTGPYLDERGKDLAQGGGNLFLGTTAEKIGPGHIGILSEDGIDRFSFHYYGALSDGAPTLGIETLLWGDDGWPRAGADVLSGRYSLISELSGLALGNIGPGVGDGEAIGQSDYHNGPDQQWNIASVGDGYFCISSLANGRYMDLADCSTKDATAIRQFRWLRSDCQKWRIEQTSDGAYRILSKGGGTALSLPAGTVAPLTPVQGIAWKNDPGQEWILKPLQ